MKAVDPGSFAQPALWAFEDEELEPLLLGRESPCFFYRGEVAAAAYRGLRAALPERVTIAYAVKANAFSPLLRRFADLGSSFDCASLGELEAISAYTGNRPCFFTGPGKSEAEIRRAIALGVRIQAESAEDLAMVEAFSEGLIEVSLRVHPLRAGEETRGIIGGSGPSAFGVDEEDLPELLAWAKGLRKVRIRGLHVFTATNQTSVARLVEDYRRTFALAERLEREVGMELDLIDVGGGLGVRYVASEPGLDLAEFGGAVAELLRENRWFRGRVVVEPGRFLSAAAGVYVTSVRREKLSRGQRLVICAGGINHLIRPLLTGQSFPVRLFDPRRQRLDEPRSKAILAGPLCTSLDRLGEADLPRLRVGDRLVFGSCGAYGASEAMTHFLSHAPAEEVWVD